MNVRLTKMTGRIQGKTSAVTCFLRFTAVLSAIFIAWACRALPAAAQQLSERTGAYSPEEELAGFTVPEGFVVELVASEQDGVVKPIDLSFDDAGRLWTQTARMYPLDPVTDIQWSDLLELMNDREKQENHPAFKRVLDLYQGKIPGTDQILVISNLYGKDKPEVNVWAEGLANPMSILPYKNGAYVAQGSELFFLDDTDRDGRPDKRIPLLGGFGFTDSHTMTHLLTRGPGGWIYFSHGALNKGEVSSYKSGVKLNIDYSKIARFNLDASRLELVSCGLNNIWGMQLRAKGQWYGSEANDLGYSVVPMEPGTGFPGIGNEQLRPYQPFMPALHEFRVGGTGLSGLAFCESTAGSFPSEWKNVAFLANPITSSINAVRIVRNPDGSVSAEHLPDLLTSKDDWFRPVNLKFGPDGCLYIADWYNKIISHNEVPTSHPDRDKTHGRIWRIRHVSQQPRTIPDLQGAKTARLAEHLRSPSLWEKRAAWHQIAERAGASHSVAGVSPAGAATSHKSTSLKKDLRRFLADTSLDEATRIHALWSLEAIGEYDAGLWHSLLEEGRVQAHDRMDDLRREAIRSLASFPLDAGEVAAALDSLAEDSNPMIRSQVLRTLAETGKANGQTIAILVRACKPELSGNQMGGSYERRFERYLARKTLEQYPEALHDYLDEALPGRSSNVAPVTGSDASAERTAVARGSDAAAPAENLLWAIQALPRGRKEAAFLDLWPYAGITELDESTFVALSSMLSNQAVYEQIKPVVENPEHAAKYLRFALDNQAGIQSPELTNLLQAPITTLLRQKKQPGTDLALDAIARFKADIPEAPIIAVFGSDTSGKTIGLIIKALEVNRSGSQEVFARLIGDSRLSFDLRSTALHALAGVNATSAQTVLKSWIPSLSAEQKRSLAETLSGSMPGANLLIDSYDKKLIGTEAFTLSAAERIQESQPDDSRGAALLAKVREQQEAARLAAREKLGRYIIIAEKKAGNPVKGAVLFQTCLMCHSVGKQGVNLGPALDGSANRDNEALLTAILDPDVAVESGYAAYRVTRKDGSNYQGLLIEKNDRGTTIAFMGGSNVFIEASEIKSQGFIPGRSFMPKGLIAYIKTLE